MKGFLIFIVGFVAGVVAMIFANKTDVVGKEPTQNGLIGLTVFPEKGECITTLSKKESTELDILQVIEPNKALGNIRNYTDKNLYGDDNYRDYDISNDIVVLLINDKGKTFYDDQKLEVTDKCIRQIGTYKYTTNMGLEKTVPAVVIE